LAIIANAQVLDGEILGTLDPPFSGRGIVGGGAPI
jgi:hypothetical protein